MPNLVPFSFDNTPIRVVTDERGEPWFVAADVAAILDYRTASDMTRMLGEDEKGTQIVSTLGGPQEATIISESGLYACILKSRKPDAANGPQPKGTAIVFIDGNTDNLSLDNLACVTRAELARLNQLGWRHLRSPEARQAMIAEARLLTQAHRRARELGLNWGQRRRLIPQRTKIATPSKGVR